MKKDSSCIKNSITRSKSVSFTILRRTQKSVQVCTENNTSARYRRLLRQLEENIFDYFVFNIVGSSVNCGLPRSGAHRRHALAQIIGNARGLDINSPRSAEAHTQDLRLHRHQQRNDLNNARGLDKNLASDRDCDSMTTTRLRHHRLRRADHAAPDKS
jgi:hypothetical protein